MEPAVGESPRRFPMSRNLVKNFYGASKTTSLCNGFAPKSKRKNSTPTPNWKHKPLWLTP